MKIFTDKQKSFFVTKEIKSGSSYMFPRFGFTFYPDASYNHGTYMDTNPFTKSLDKELFYVKDVSGNFCKGNFVRKPLGQDFYIEKNELESRDMFEALLLFIFCCIPFVIYNLYKSLNH